MLFPFFLPSYFKKVPRTSLGTSIDYWLFHSFEIHNFFRYSVTVLFIIFAWKCISLKGTSSPYFPELEETIPCWEKLSPTPTLSAWLPAPRALSPGERASFFSVQWWSLCPPGGLVHTLRWIVNMDRWSTDVAVNNNPCYGEARWILQTLPK